MSLVEMSGNLYDALSIRLFGNSLRDYAVSLVSMLAGFLAVRIFKRSIIRRLKKWSATTATGWDDLFIAALETNAIPSLYLLVFYLALRNLELNPFLGTALASLISIGVAILLIRILMALAKHGIKSYWSRHGQANALAEKNINGIITMANILIWVLGSVLLLDNLGVKISAVVTGLGITGIAVALAGQAILADLFSYFVIFFDQPFDVGHSIKVDGFVGEVEHIGLKTTRIRSIDGEQIVVSNKYLTDSRVQNFKRMKRRRILFDFAVEHRTGTEELRNIPEILKSLLAQFPEVTFDRAHFKSFQTWGLQFEVVYFVETPDYRIYMDIQHNVNLGLHQAFAKSGIVFAMPVHPASRPGPSLPT